MVALQPDDALGRRPATGEDDRLIGRGRLDGLEGWIEVLRRAIESVRPSPKGAGLLEVRFGESRKSRLLRYLTRGELDGVVLLNPGESGERWLAALQEVLPGLRPAGYSRFQLQCRQITSRRRGSTRETA